MRGGSKRLTEQQSIGRCGGGLPDSYQKASWTAIMDSHRHSVNGIDFDSSNQIPVTKTSSASCLPTRFTTTDWCPNAASRTYCTPRCCQKPHVRLQRPARTTLATKEGKANFCPRHICRPRVFVFNSWLVRGRGLGRVTDADADADCGDGGVDQLLG